jgi:phospholipid/cholesterol/gamma-HCH transport system permease protein
MSSFLNFFWKRAVHLGTFAWSVLQSLGSFFLFTTSALLLIFQKKQLRSIFQQIYFIGVSSTMIISLVALFTGMVLGLQLYYTLIKFGAVGAVGAAVSLTLIRELGPVLAAIMITARAGSAMATEIGVQRITEQVDALTTMGINPVRFLVSPRIMAAVISFPILTSLFDLVGILGAYLSSVLLLGLDKGAYFYRVQSSIVMDDIISGLVKALIFGILVSSICCYQGYNTHLRKDTFGAKAVGNATTSAVVISCVCILIVDYIVTSFLL